MATPTVCWSSGLPSDVLPSILHRLPPLDYARSTAVCRSWHSLASSDPIPPQELPWLMLPMATDPDQEDRTLCNFYSLSHRLSFPVRLPSPAAHLRWSRCVNSSNGWLMLADNLANLHMLNPLTRAHFPLPPITTLSGVEPVHDDLSDPRRITGYHIKGYDTPSPLEDVCNDFFRKAVVGWTTTDSPSSSSYTVMAIISYNLFECAAYAYQGCSGWIPLGIRHSIKWVMDIEHYNGLFYVQQINRLVSAYKLSGDAPVIVTNIIHDVGGYKRALNSYWCAKIYLVQLPGSHLLQVMRYVAPAEKNASGYRTNQFDVYKVVNGQPEQVTDLGDYSLFLGDNGSICISASEYPSAGRNCIYFSADLLQSYPEWERDVGVYHLKDRSFSAYCSAQLPLPYSGWLMPNPLKQGTGN